MTTPKALAITQATAIASGLTDGTLGADDLIDDTIAAVRDLFGAVVGPGDPNWPMHVDVARQVLAVGGGLTADELAQYVDRYRARPGSWIERALAEGGDDE